MSLALGIVLAAVFLWWPLNELAKAVGTAASELSRIRSILGASLIQEGTDISQVRLISGELELLRKRAYPER